MKVKLRTEKAGKMFRFWVPAFVVLGTLNKESKDGDKPLLSAENMKRLKKGIRKAKKHHKDWTIVQVQSEDGLELEVKM